MHPESVSSKGRGPVGALADGAVAALLGVAAGHAASRWVRGLVAPPAAPAVARRQHIPLRVVLANVYREIVRDRVLAVAGGVGFFTLFSLFPALAAFVSLFGLFASASRVSDLMIRAGTLLPPAASDLVRGQVEALTAASSASLSVASAVAVAVSVWSANGATKAMLDALNVAYGVEEQRGLVRYNALSLLFTLGAVSVVILLLLAFAAIPVLLDRVWLGWTVETVMSYGRWPLIVLVIMTAIALLYRFGPNLPHARWRWITPGSVLATLGIVGFSLLFSWYASNWAHYNETYGSLSAAIVFMTWTWLSTAIVLVGAELNAELDRLAR